MLWRRIRQYRHHLVVLLMLSFASLVSATMVSLRIVYTGQTHFTFMWWNLFLAWLPLLFALMAAGLRRRPLLLLIPAFFWLIFLPNAPYMVTDLMHLNWPTDAPLWFDAIMLFSFAMTGILLGFTSLAVMHGLASRLLGRLAGWLFVCLSLGLTSFGVYMGRFLRWNSWDLIANPSGVMLDVLHIVRYPQDNLRTFVVWSLLTAVLVFTYVILVSLPRAAVEPDRSS
jgi:uncharacterized membrane protein